MLLGGWHFACCSMDRIPRISRLLTCFVLLLWAQRACAQSVDDAGQWNALFAQGDFAAVGCENDRIKWWFDGHIRLLDDADGFNQSIVRPGIGWSLNERSTVWVGYAWIRTAPLSGSEFDESRIWQQWTWSNGIENWKFAHRSRFEQRLVETGDDLGLRYRQLFRAQYNFPALPRMTLVGWNELFYNLYDADWGAQSGFDQNRAFAGLGFKPKPDSRWTVEIGYLNQVIEVPSGSDRNNHILSLNLFRSP
jgi:hypothetical protein